MDCSPQGSSLHGIFQVRILDWVAISSSIELHLTLKIKYQVLTVTPTFFMVHFNRSILWVHTPQLHLHQLLLWPTFFPDISMPPFFSSLWSLLKWHLSRGFFPGLGSSFFPLDNFTFLHCTHHHLKLGCIFGGLSWHLIPGMHAPQGKGIGLVLVIYLVGRAEPDAGWIYCAYHTLMSVLVLIVQKQEVKLSRSFRTYASQWTVHSQWVFRIHCWKWKFEMQFLPLFFDQSIKEY